MATRILIADDSPTERASLAELFRKEGFETVTVGTCEEILVSCRGDGSCVLVLDLNEGSANAIKVLACAKEKHPYLPVIGLAADSQVREIIEAMRSGADDVLLYPAEPDQLRAAVERARKRADSMRELGANEAEIERLSSLNQQIIRHSPIPLAVVDLNGATRYINAPMARLIGVPPASCIGENFVCLVEGAAEEIDPAFGASIARVLAGAASLHVNAIHTRLSGVDRYFDLDLAVLAGSETGEGVLVALYDVSQWIVGHELVNSVVRDSTDAVVVADEHLVIRLWSRGAEGVFGYAASEIVGRPLTTIFPVDQQDIDPAALLKKLVDAPSSKRERTARRRRDGSLVEVELSQFGLSDPQGRPVGVCEVSRDITLDVARQREIEGIKEFYEHIVDTISDGIRVIAARDRKIVLANEAHLEQVGLSAGDVIGRISSEIPWGRDKDGEGVFVDGLVDRTLSSGAPERETFACRTAASERIHWMDIAAYPMENALGVIEHVVLVGRDISERVEMADNLAAERDSRDQVFVSAPIGILTTDADGEIKFANPNVAQIFDVLGSKEIVGQSLFRLKQVQEAGLTTKLWGVLSDGIPLRQDHVTCTSAEGRAIIIDIRAEPLVVDKEITGLVAVIEDVTEKLTLQRRLSATTADLTMLAEIGELFQESRDPDLILQTILVGVTAGEGLGFNRAFFLATNWETRELRGKYAIGPASPEEAWRVWQELKATPHTLHDVLNGYREAMKRGEVRINEVARDLVISLEDAENIAARAALERRAFLVTEGHNRPLVPTDLADRLGTDSFAVVPLIFSDAVEGVIIADNAITGKKISDFDLRSLELFAHQARLAVERARLYDELEQRLSEIQEVHNELKEHQELMLKNERLAAMGQTAAQVAHEIRNPLVAIGGFARNIARSLDENDRNREYIQIIVDEATRLEKILRDVLEFSRPKAGDKTAADLVCLVRRTLGTMQGELAERHIDTRINLPSGPVLVRADADQICQVLQNLMHNAIDAMTDEGRATPQEGTAGTLTISLETGHGKAVVSVEDTGGGLDEEMLHRIFEPFFTTKSHGTGLGLAICQQIMHDHGGEIAVANKPGHGAVFSLVLPFEKEVDDGANSRD